MQNLQDRLAEVAVIAVALQNKTLCPAQETVSQWAVESQWGGKPAGQHNYFGIKRADRHTKFCLVPTHEEFTQAEVDAWNHAHPDRPCRSVRPLANGKFDVILDDEFADYDSLADSCADFAWLITNGDPYRGAWLNYLQDKSVMGLIAGVARVYATSSAYAHLVAEIAGQNNVTAAIAKARLSA